MVVDRDNALSDPVAGKRSCVDREVAAFRVPARADFSFQRACCALHIVCRLKLRGYRRHVRHVEVLFPPDERVVRAAKRDEYRTVAGKERERRELLFLRPVGVLGVSAYPHTAEPLARPGFPQHFERRGIYQRPVIGARLKVGGVEKKPRRVGDRHRLFREIGRYQSVEIDIGNLAENNAVNFVERVYLERDIAAPVQIIKNVSSPCSPPDPFVSYIVYSIMIPLRDSSAGVFYLRPVPLTSRGSPVPMPMRLVRLRNATVSASVVRKSRGW